MGPMLQNQVCYALYSASSKVTQAYRPLLEPLNLTYPQFVVLMALWQKDFVSVTELAKVVGLSKPTMTPLLKRLELLHYISRDINAEDDRQKCIALTALGKSLATEANTIALQAECATSLNEDEVKQLISLSNKIKIALNH